MLTASLSDDDGNVRAITWQWSRSMTMDGTYSNIVGATNETYTPVEGDGGYYLMATATYTDAYGSGMSAKATTGPVTAVADRPGTVTLSMSHPVVDTAITASLSDPDGMISGTTWQWSRSMTMDGTLMDIDGATMMSYTPMDADVDYYLRATVMYTDGHGSGKMQMATTTGMVTAVADQPGTVSLSSMTPQVDVALTATLTDADGSVTDTTWQWSKSMTMDGTFMDISTNATTMSYTPMTADVGYYLRATVMYTDGHGSGKMMMATTANMVTATAVDPTDKYDTNVSGMIERAEVVAVINRYIAGEAGVTRADVVAVINRYIAGN